MAENIKVEDIAAAFRQVGAVPGDLVLYHGSMKSIGFVEGGPQAVADGVLESVSPGGTIAIPTLWYTGRLPGRSREEDFSIKSSPSWNGAMAEAVRLDPRSIRSNHWTHSVSAIGPRAAELTADHGKGRPYPSPWSETAFAEISPWSRLYEWNALYAFIGVDMSSCTMKHWIESRYISGILDLLPVDRRQEYRNQLRHDRQPGGIHADLNGPKMQRYLDSLDLIRKTDLGKAVVMAIRTRPMVDNMLKTLNADPGKWFSADFLAWREGALQEAGAQ